MCVFVQTHTRTYVSLSVYMRMFDVWGASVCLCDRPSLCVCVCVRFHLLLMMEGWQAARHSTSLETELKVIMCSVFCLLPKSSQQVESSSPRHLISMVVSPHTAAVSVFHQQ